MRTAILFLIYVVAIIALSPAIFFCMLFGLRGPLLVLGKGLLLVGKSVLGIRFEVSGRDRFDPRAQYVFMPNHVSFLDGPLMFLIIPQMTRVIMKKKVFGIPIVGWAMHRVGFIPVTRRGREEGRRSIEKATRLMRERGYSFLIFPEGTRSLDGKLGALRRGGFFLAVNGGAPIVPVTIRGALELMPKGRFKARRGTVDVVFHEPIAIEGRTAEDIPGLQDRVAAAIRSGL